MLYFKKLKKVQVGSVKKRVWCHYNFLLFSEPDCKWNNFCDNHFNFQFEGITWPGCPQVYFSTNQSNNNQWHSLNDKQVFTSLNLFPKNVFFFFLRRDESYSSSNEWLCLLLYGFMGSYVTWREGYQYVASMWFLDFQAFKFPFYLWGANPFSQKNKSKQDLFLSLHFLVWHEEAH